MTIDVHDHQQGRDCGIEPAPHGDHIDTWSAITFTTRRATIATTSDLST